MIWIFSAQTFPGQELAESVLQADAVHAMQLVVFLVVLGWVLSTWQNGRAISRMSATQQDMNKTNTQFIEATNKNTATLQASVDEQKLLRQDYTTSSLTHQRLVEQAKTAIDAHEDKAEGRVKTIIDQVTAGTESIHGALKDAVTTVNAATLEAVQPALMAIDKLVLLSDNFSTRQEATREMLRVQHEEEMRFLTEQHDAHMRIWREQLTQAQQQILDSLKKAEEKPSDEKPVEVLPPLPVADGLPADDGSITNIVGVGPGSDSRTSSSSGGINGSAAP